MDGSVIIWWLQTIIELSLTAGAAVCSLSSEWPEVTSYTEFLRFSEFSCHQAADSLLSLNTKEGGTSFYPLSHCTLFHSSVPVCVRLMITVTRWHTPAVQSVCPWSVRGQVIITGPSADVWWPGHLLSVSLCISRLFWPGVISDLCCSLIYCRQRVTSHIAIFLSLHL